MRQGNIAHTPVLEKEIADLEGLRTLIQTNQDKLFFVTVFISLTCESLEKLNEKSKILEAEMNKKTAMVRTLIFKQIDGLKQMLPTGEIALAGFERNMVSGGVATLMPITNPNVSHSKGTFLGISEKADYFKDLGVNGIVLMPVADFPEVKVRELPPITSFLPRRTTTTNTSIPLPLKSTLPY